MPNEISRLETVSYVVISLGFALFFAAHIISWKMGSTLKKNLDRFNSEHVGRRTGSMSFGEVIARAWSNKRDMSLLLGFHGMVLIFIGFVLYIMSLILFNIRK
jgi:hypothetical protein